uniref:Uncharacterized protein n=1 Tax=Anguilla anguilla TaxID=7936 RepID=A0A0E9P7L3_ANGAN
MSKKPRLLKPTFPANFLLDVNKTMEKRREARLNDWW